ncbi:MAG: hypothetical protein ABSF23_12985 [Terracidiphilus sp.]|jgi:hypothetical protein
MRKWVLLLMLVGMAAPAEASKPTTVEQLEELLAKLTTKADGKVAQELADVEITQRVSSRRLARWETEFTGPRAHEALMKLADASAFLKAPPGDAIPDPAPDAETQQRMLWLAVQYVKTTMTRLPDFSATRETVHFESAPEQRTDTGLIVNRNRDPEAGESARLLHNAGTTSVTVTFRNGHEENEANTAGSTAPGSPAIGLTTSGEFGPILEVVIGDAMRGTVEWLRWEQGESDPVAVFRYAVPDSLSHYTVFIPKENKMEAYYPAYSGEIAIDPATGAIVRLSVLTQMQPPFDRMSAAILVEYATVTIGDSNYVCPVKGLALSKVPAAGAIATPQSWDGPMVTQLNDVTFTDYHVLRPEARIVGGAGGSGAPSSDTAPPDAGQH